MQIARFDRNETSHKDWRFVIAIAELGAMRSVVVGMAIKCNVANLAAGY